MVETTTLYNKGVKTGAIDDDAIMVGVPYGWRLIEAPLPTSKQGYSLIFWEPSSAEDREPAFEKVVSYLSYLSLTVHHHVSTDWCLYPWRKVHEPHIW
jgi:hypothetical protein